MPSRLKFSSPLPVYSLPILDKFLVYAPLHHLVTLVNRDAVSEIRSAVHSGKTPAEAVRPVLEILAAPGDPPPSVRTGALNDPLFLGLITTRGCNMGCRYCDFPAPKSSSPEMTLDLARRALDSYFRLLQDSGSRHAAVHFFGGEPFYADRVVHFAVEYAAQQAARLGMQAEFEAATNGLFDSERCRWIAARFDTVVLSLDGPQDIQERQRPALIGESFDRVEQNARVLSEGEADLALRACVSAATVGRMEEIAGWFTTEFRPASVCFAPLVESRISRKFGLLPPQAIEFARNFHKASVILERRGVKPVFSTADLTRCRTSFCPVGKDALIVSPDGSLDACYLFPGDWQSAGLDLRYGRMSPSGMEFDPGSVQRIRDLTAADKSLCAVCLCRWHCAGGCHVRHPCSARAARYDDVCVQTRLITAAVLLRQLGQAELADAWMDDPRELKKTALQKSDRLIDGGEGK
jgi:uncharacterized protein